MKIIPLSEGTFTVDKSKHFVPFTVHADKLRDRPAGSLLVEIQPFVVITSKDILLFDTGLGFEKDGVLQIHRNLMDNGINPSEVTKVLLTHLHKDHSGGIQSGTDKLSFSNALYYIQKKELTFAFEKGLPSFVIEELEPLKDSDRVVLLDGNGMIDGYISYELTGAHSPHHQVFWVNENRQTIFFGGDETPQLQQMKHRFVAKYDFNGKKAMELRRKWWESGRKEKWTILFYHDVKNPVFQF
jgi:glyoxylase-like metal-dependent hydrolase (beta-lactamase superfamily II)